MRLATDSQGRVYSVDGPPVNPVFNGGIAFDPSTLRVYITNNPQASDVYLGGNRVSALGELVFGAGTPPNRPYNFNAGIPARRTDSATVGQVDQVPDPTDPFVARVRVGPLGGVYLNHLSQKTDDEIARDIIASYGANAQMYLAGVGTVSTYPTENYDSNTGTTPAVVDVPNGVGGVGNVLGAGNQLSQATLANRPTLRTNGVSFWWEFDGVSDYLEGAFTLFTGGDDLFMIQAVQFNSTSGNQDSVCACSTVTGSTAIELRTNSGEPRARIAADGSGNVQSTWGSVEPVGSPMVLTLRKVSTDLSVYVESVEGTSVSTAGLSAVTPNVLSIGAKAAATVSVFANCNVFATLIVKGTISNDDLLKLQGYIGRLAGIVI